MKIVVSAASSQLIDNACEVLTKKLDPTYIKYLKTNVKSLKELVPASMLNGIKAGNDIHIYSHMGILLQIRKLVRLASDKPLLPDLGKGTVDLAAVELLKHLWKHLNSKSN